MAFAAPACARVGCGKYPWNGKAGEFCSKRRRAAGSASIPVSGPTAPSAPAAGDCAQDGCNMPSWNGQPGEFCSLKCHSASQLPKMTRCHGSTSMETTQNARSAVLAAALRLHPQTALSGGAKLPPTLRFSDARRDSVSSVSSGSSHSSAEFWQFHRFYRGQIDRLDFWMPRDMIFNQVGVLSLK